MSNPQPKPDAPPPAEVAKDPLAGLCRGRIVLYWPLPYESRFPDADQGPWPAMVTHVGDNGACTLNVNLPMPVPIGEDPVARRKAVPFSSDRAPGTWGWMFPGQGTRYEAKPAAPQEKP